MNEDEQRYAEMYCKCRGCGCYQLGLKDGLCDECFALIILEIDEDDD